MGKVIGHDFGKKARETVARFSRLTGIIEQYEADVLANPLKHIELANIRISKLNRLIRNARDTLRAPLPAWVPHNGPLAYPDIETVNVPKDEYERLRACANAVIQADKECIGYV